LLKLSVKNFRKIPENPYVFKQTESGRETSPAALGLGMLDGHSSQRMGADPPDIFAMEKMTL